MENVEDHTQCLTIVQSAGNLILVAGNFFDLQSQPGGFALNQPVTGATYYKLAMVVANDVSGNLRVANLSRLEHGQSSKYPKPLSIQLLVKMSEPGIVKYGAARLDASGKRGNTPCYGKRTII